jgi:isopentenyl diphosphate isomerase/L-lactate dehydrogenase-like FMN-dependent dehydrogenase
MNRRFFSQLLAFGAGLFSTTQIAAKDDAAGSKNGADKPDGHTPVSSTASSGLPVTVSDFVGQAAARLPRASFDYVTTGSEDEVTLRDNVEAFRRIRVLPPLLHGVDQTDLSTTVLGQKISMPVLLAPVAALRMLHPEGVLASARAATRAGTICAASSSALNSVEEIGSSSSGPKWFQVYVPRKRNVAAKLVARAEAAGFKAIVVTVDLGERKDADLRNRFTVPKDMLLKHLRDVGFSHLTDRNSHEELNAFNAAAWDISLNVDFFRWLRGVTKLPILLKGVLSPDAAQQAVDLGLNGIIVSNHGGRRLDGMPASIDVLHEVAQAVDGKIEILMDGGVRRGGDVMKALAYGAKAVLIGRPQAWALAAGGEAGVKRVLDILRDELTNAMIASGCATVDDVSASLLRV